jgi:threonine dehydratase
MISLSDIRAARERIAGAVRRTPMLRPGPTTTPLAPGADVVLKLECLQVTGSFKARGALNKLRSLTPAEVARGIVTASGGNHGIAVAYAGRAAGTPATVFVPTGVAPAKAAKIKGYGAELRIEGSVWDEANHAATALAATGVTYFHPFADDHVMAGQGTVALEMLEDAPDIDTILVAIGGGGLISGMAIAAKALKPGVRIIGVEPTGAPTLHAALAAGRVVQLERITTKVPTLAAGKTEQVNFDVVQKHVERVVLIEDADMTRACEWLWRELGVAADPSGAAAVAALLVGAYKPAPGEKICALVCGAGADGTA